MLLQVSFTILLLGTIFLIGLILGIFLSRKQLLFLSEPDKVIPADTSGSPENELADHKYQNFHLPERRKTQYLQQVYSLIEEEKVYKEAHLTLPKLSQRLAIPPKYLSQVINEKCQVRFSEIINQYRIKEAQQLLLDPAYLKFSISGVASEVGFSNRQSFHQTFKRITGTTPGKYRESCQDSGIPTYYS